MTLDQLVEQSALRAPDAVAVQSAEEAVTYGELDAIANQMARALRELNVAVGDRVGLWLEKSIRGVAGMQAALRLGAAYVPLDPASPLPRIERILRDCQIRVVIASADKATLLRALDPALQIRVLCVEGQGPTDWESIRALPASGLSLPTKNADDIAYILYTSGSTGVPKGVCISHRNALAFVEWAADEVKVSATDRLGNHAPFNFDLSVFDLYAAWLRGAAVVLVPGSLAFAPRQLVEFVARARISVWYSVPSALILMMAQGGLLENPNIVFRVVIFAGEPFPVKHLRRFARG